MKKIADAVLVALMLMSSVPGLAETAQAASPSAMVEQQVTAEQSEQDER